MLYFCIEVSIKKMFENIFLCLQKLLTKQLFDVTQRLKYLHFY